MPYDYEFSLWDEIRRRTQGSQEKVISFVVAMQNLFNKLPEAPTEATKIQLLRRNLLPYLQGRLATQNISSVQELLRLSRSVEETELRLQRFVPPPTNYRQLLEPELAYHKPSYNVHALNTSESLSFVEPTAQTPADCDPVAVDVISSSREQNVCWNCGSPEHRFRQCQQERKMFCYRCGKDKVTLKSCPTCSKNEQPVRH